MSDYNKPKRGKQTLTPAARDVLSRIQNANVLYPSIREIIAAFNLPTSQQNIQEMAKNRRKKMEGKK